MKKKKRKAKRNKEKSYAGLIAVVVALIVLVGMYSVAGVYFSTHFLPGTTLNNTDVSLLSIDGAKEMLVSSSEMYSLTLYEQDRHQETINSSDIELKTSVSEDFNHILDSESGFLWLVNLFKDKSYTLDEGVLTYEYDESLLGKVIDKLQCVKPQYPIEAKDAELVLMNGEFKIVPESVGNVAHRDDLEEKIKYAVETQKPSINLEAEGVYDMPKVKSDDEDLIAKKAACDEIVDMVITLKFGMKDEEIGIDTIAGWVKAEKNDDGAYELKTIDKKVKAFVKTLAEEYDTVGKPKAFTTHTGDVVDITTGDYGWLMDQDEAVEKLEKLVLAKKSVTVDLTEGTEQSAEWWLRTAVGYDANGGDYYGTTYAEVSIAEQHMWMYQDGEIVLDTDVVTGNPNLGNDTPVGAFRIRYHQVNAILRGPGYATPVAYWIVFADDVGFHDATWQPYFGGQLYLSNGSHGCVNMPLDQAGYLFNLVYDGMPVFVY